MRKFKTSKFLFLFGCAISIVYLILIIFSEANVHVRPLAGDEGSYLSAMRSLYIGKLHLVRPPVYPAILYALNSTPYLTSTASSNLIYALQFALWIITFRLILTFFPEKKHWAWVVVFLLIIINPSFVQYTNMILTEIVFLFIVILGFVFLSKHFKTKRDIGLVIFVSCMLLATLVRPGLFYFTLLAVGVSLFYFIKKNRLIATATIVALSILFLALPMRIMKNTYGHYTISYIDKITQSRYLNARAASIAEASTVDFEMEKRTFFVKNANDKASIKQLVESINTETKDFIFTKPFIYTHAFSQNLFMNFHSGNEYLPKTLPIIGKHFYGLSRILNMLFTIALQICIVFFCIQFFRTRRKHELIFPSILLFYCFYSWFTSGVSFFQGDRFNVVWMPILVIFIFHFFNKANYEKE